MTRAIVTTSNQRNRDMHSRPDCRKIPGQQMVVLNRFKVDEEMFERVRAQFEAIRPNLLECEDYTIGELLGEDFLANLSDTESRLAILCMEHLADQTGSNLADKRGSGSHLEFLWTGQ